MQQLPVENWYNRRLETVTIPGIFCFRVQTAIVTGTPKGDLRYMRFLVDRAGRVPSGMATEVIGHELGFKGSHRKWSIREEPIAGDNRWALRVVQPLG